MAKDTAHAGDDSLEPIVNELRMTFKEEAYELLAELEHALLELEKAPDDKEHISRVFRAVHTMKGSGGACEFHDIVAFTHELETFLDQLRSGKTVTKEIINLTLLARDQLKSLVNRYYQGETADDAKSAEILESFKGFFKKTTEHDKANPCPDKSSNLKEVHSGVMTYRIRFRPHENIFAFGMNPLHLFKKLHELGTCNIFAHTERIPTLEHLDARASYVYWDIILTTNQSMNAVRDVFIVMKDSCELKLDFIDKEAYLDDEMTYKNIGEILLERGDLAPHDLEKVLKVKKRVGEMLVETGIVSGTQVESALIEQQHVREMRQHRLRDTSSSIRVSIGKLDNLVNLVGELVTVQARLSQTAQSSELSTLLSIAEEVERLTESLRGSVMNIRMLPIGSTFNKFQRMVRDLSVELGKEVEMTTEGGDTELDKTVIEQLSDPLVHIIRNSIGHGIELPDVREAAGKPKKGRIHLSALHSGANVLIRVHDDGAGVDQEALRAKAVEKGLLAPDAVLTEQEVFSFMFAPGFTTTKIVTDVSGRGVGLDVVKKTIELLRGSIELSSQRGTGTTITLKIPLTLAIIDGLLVTIGEQYYVLPISFVKECVDLTAADKENSHGRQIASVRGELVPYINLKDHFLITGRLTNEEQIVITEADGKRIGFVVDTVVGGHQTVIKNLGAFYQYVEGVSGATILGDGTVALILDVPKLVRRAEREEFAMYQGSTAVAGIQSGNSAHIL